jgi:hypothetical protein
MPTAAGMSTASASVTTATAAWVTATFTAWMPSTSTGGMSATAWMSAATTCVCGWACVSTTAKATAVSGRCTTVMFVGGHARGTAPGTNYTASRTYRAASGSEPTTAAVDVTSSAGVDEAMTTPTVSVAPVGPWTYAKKDAVIEIASPVETDRRTGVGWVFVVAVTTNRRRTADTNHDLSIARRHTCQRRSHCY